MCSGRPRPRAQTLALLPQPRRPPPPLSGMDPPPQHLVDQVERARQSARGRHRGSFSRRPAWAGMIPQPPRPQLPDQARRALQDAYGDVYDPEEEAMSAARAVAEEAMSAARAVADAAEEAEMEQTRRAAETARRAARRKRQRDVVAAAKADATKAAGAGGSN